MSLDQQRASDILSQIDELARYGKLYEAVSSAKNHTTTFEYLRSHNNTLSFRIPNLLIIGPARTGTTWIKSTLSRHPDIIMFPGEPNILWGISAGNLANSLQLYAQQRTSKNSRHKRITAEKSPGYIALPDSDICMLSAINPKIKIY